MSPTDYQESKWFWNICGLTVGGAAMNAPSPYANTMAE
jgi:hypothetical protein